MGTRSGTVHCSTVVPQNVNTHRLQQQSVVAKGFCLLLMQCVTAGATQLGPTHAHSHIHNYTSLQHAASTVHLALCDYATNDAYIQM